MRNTVWGSLGCGCLMALAVAACSKPMTGANPSNSSTTSTAANQTSGLPAVNANNVANLDGPPLSDPNACNAFINNTKIGQPCTGAFGTGVNVCVLGEVTCEECVPNSTRTASCPCGMARNDTCSAAGTWNLGSCNACPGATVALSSCQQTDACNPGDTKYTVCDIPEAPTAALPCVGQKYTCNDNCQWAANGNCALQARQCNQDQTEVAACGSCGVHTLACTNGCFWDDIPCANNGACVAGTKLQTLCGGTPSDSNECAPGINTVQCNSQCQWDPPSACATCQLGQMQNITVPCSSVDGANPCGTATEVQQCTAIPFTTCADTNTPSTYNGWTTAANIPPDTSACTPAVNCQQPLPGPPPPACQTQVCTPNSTSTASCTTSANYCNVPGQQVTTCDGTGCGSEVSSCTPINPVQCSPGDTQEVACPGCHPGYFAKQTCQDCTWTTTDDSACKTCF